MIKAELEEAKSLLGPGDWSFEIAKMVEQQDIKKMFSIIEDITKKLREVVR